MKNPKSILLATFLILFSITLSAQSTKVPSVILAEKASWFTQSKEISVTEALKGVNARAELELQVELQLLSLKNTGENIQKFEIKWYRYGSRGLYLTDSFVETINLSEKTKNKESITISSSRKNLLNGLWIVKIIAYYDNGFVALDGKTQYKIKVL